MIRRIRNKVVRILQQGSASEAQLHALSRRVDELVADLRDLNARSVDDARSEVHRVRTEVDQLAHQVRDQTRYNHDTRNWLTEHTNAMQSHLEVRISEQVDNAAEGFRTRLRRAEIAAQAAASTAAASPAAASAPVSNDPADSASSGENPTTVPAVASPAVVTTPSSNPFGLSYSAFEDELRGSVEHVRNLERVHVESIQGFGAEGLAVLDVGCGRGELLAMLGEVDIPARGVDLNATSIAECQADGLDAVHGDAIELLNSLAPHSLRAVVGLHIVEHLTEDERNALFAAAYRAIAPGGGLIVETPNPENLRVGATTFWLDPTHLRPLPPQLLQFQVSMAGFEHTEIQRLHPSDDSIAIDPADDSLAAATAAFVNRLVAGPMDYAIVARKAEA